MLSAVIVINSMFWLKVVSFVGAVVLVGWAMYNHGCNKTADAFGVLLEQITGAQADENGVVNINLDQVDVKLLKEEINRLEKENCELKEKLKNK